MFVLDGILIGPSRASGGWEAGGVGAFRRSILAVVLGGLIVGLFVPSASAVEPCLGIDANGDGEIDVPPTDPDCVVVAFAVEPEKNNIVDLDFINTHAAVLWTPSFDPSLVRDVPLCFGDADNPSNRACTPVTQRGKFRDVNGDGHADKIWKWPANKTGIQSGDTSACIYGTTTDGRKLEACDSMTTIGGPGSVFSVNDVSVVEGSSGTTDATFTVSLSPARTSQSSVSYTTVNGTAVAPQDYEATAGQLTFDPGDTSKSVTVQISGDATPENDETFMLQLSAPSSGSTIGDGTGTGTILTDDAASAASIGDVTVSEGDSGTVVATFTVSITPPSAEPVAVSWATTDGTADAPTDYQADSGTLNFAAGEGSKTIGVLVNGDTSPEASEAFSVDITSGDVSIGDGHGVATILNDDSIPTITISDVSLPEGNSGSSIAGFLVTLSNPSGGVVTVSFATVDGTAKAPGDYISTSGTLTFLPGEVSKVIEVPVKGDMLTERDETFFVNLTNASGATTSDPQGMCVILTDGS